MILFRFSPGKRLLFSVILLAIAYNYLNDAIRHHDHPLENGSVGLVFLLVGMVLGFFALRWKCRQWRAYFR